MIEDDAADFGDRYWRSAIRVDASLPRRSSPSIDDVTFQTLADNIPTLCWVANGDGFIFWYNRLWHDYCGSTPESMEGWGWTSVHDPDVLPEVMQRWTAAISTGAPFEMTFPLRGADGTFRPFLTRIQPVRDASGQIARWFGVNTEISAQLATERERLWRSSLDIFIAVDKAGQLVSVSPAATTILGWLPAEMVGQSVYDFIVPDDTAMAADALSLARQGPSPVTEVRYRHKDGGSRWLSWVAAPEGDLIFATGRHVTAEKEAAAALQIAQDSLRQAQKMEAVGQLTGGLAHDFNNLLTGISGNLDLLQKRLVQGRVNDLDRYIIAAQGAAKRAAALTHRLLAFSRRQTLDPRSTNINRLIAGMEELVRRTMGPAVDLEVVGAVGLWTTLVDPNQLENALLNLCINARDAMPDGGRLTIETGNRRLDARAAQERDLAPGQYVSLCVSDTGTGMTPEVIARAFDPFFTTKPIGQGTGLGLSMIYGFAKQSGGQVRIYSEVGQGTAVCIYLPRHYGLEDMHEAPEVREALPKAEAGETVLVVDDEPTVRMLVTDVLSDLGYGALEAEDGATGLRVLQSDVRIDLLVTDVGLPGGINGRQVADAARALRPGLKVLFITGYAENAVLSHGHLDPGLEILTKPFAVDHLANRIRALIES